VPKGVSLDESLIIDCLLPFPDFPGTYGAISKIEFFGLIVIIFLH